jgi:hypothetical protein
MQETPSAAGVCRSTIPQIMCKLGLVLLFLLLTGNNYAQDYFVLIQSDHRQPFYVRLGGQVYSSSPEGHLILSRLKDSSYTIVIGFPGHGQTASGPTNPSHAQTTSGQTTTDPGGQELTYNFATWRKDQELQLKDHGDAGWGLYDPQTKEWMTVLARSGGREEFHAVGIRKDDAFSRMMADVVEDTAVLYNNYANSSLTASGEPTADSLAANTKPVPADSSSASNSMTIADPPPSKSAPDTSATRANFLPEAPASPPAAPVSPPAAKPTPDTVVATISKPVDTVQVRPADSTAAATVKSAARPHTDTTATRLYRPIAGTALHKSPPVTDSSTRQPLFRPAPVVVKLSERKLAHSFRQVYADKGKGLKADTVVVIIPLDTPLNAAKSHGPNPDSPTLSQGTTGYPLIVPTPVSLPTDNTRLDNTRTRTVDSGQKRPAKAPLPYVNSDCRNFATDYDVDKLRVKMLEATKDDDRIAVALKVLKTKCFYTRQVRALSEVFTTDAAKFRFFETAYPFAADEHFRELGSLLTDPVYSNKFKTLTGAH